MMENIPDHPVVSSLLKYGYPYEPKEDYCPICPVCKKEAIEFYVNQSREILGCDKCVKTIDSLDYEDKYGGCND